MTKRPRFYEEFRATYPEVAERYEALGDACRSAGPLNPRTAELIKLGIALGAAAEGAAHSHARRARAAGASARELEHVALLAITTLGFPRAMTGLAWVRDVARRGTAAADDGRDAARGGSARSVGQTAKARRSRR